MEPTAARWSITGMCFWLSLPTYSAPRRCGRLKSTWMVPHCQSRPRESFKVNSRLTPMESVSALGHRKIAQHKHFSATLVLHTFRAIEGAFARIQNVVEASELRGFGEGGFSLVPDFFGTHALWTPLASALCLSNENKRVCFRCIRLVRYSGRVENFTTISSKPKSW